MTLMTGYTVGVGSTSYFGVKNENQSWMQHSIIIINYVIEPNYMYEISFIRKDGTKYIEIEDRFKFRLEK